MKAYILYNQSTGEILRTGICDDRDFLKQAKAGEAVIERDPMMTVNDTLHKIVTPQKGVPVIQQMTPAEIEAKKPVAPVMASAIEIIAAALKVKGITLSDADLKSAEAAVIQNKATLGSPKN